MKVIQNPEDQVPAEVLAESIKKIGTAVEKLSAAGLSERAIVLLLQNASGESKTATQNVLWGLRNLEKLFLKPKANEK